MRQQYLIDAEESHDVTFRCRVPIVNGVAAELRRTYALVARGVSIAKMPLEFRLGWTDLR